MPALAPAAIAAVALALERTVLPDEVSAIAVAIILGLLAGNTVRPRGRAIELAARRLLPIAIVLIGLRVSLADVLEIGGDGLALALVAIAAGLTTALLLGRVIGVPGRLAALIAVGTAICGNTAIVAAAPILRARREEVAYAIATITSFGTLAILVFPFLGHLLDMSDRTFGLWAGAGVHDTSQVLATGFSYSEEAGTTATILKLARNAFLGPLLVTIALVVARNETAGVGKFVRLPWFVWGFALAVLVASLEVLPERAAAWALDVAHFLILTAIAAIGASTDIAGMRTAGPRPFLLGLVAMAAVSALVLSALRMFDFR